MIHKLQKITTITKTKIALISLGAVEEPEIGKRDVSHLEARARDWIEKLRKIKMKGERGVRPRKDKFGTYDETDLSALRILEHGFGLRPSIWVISRNIGLRPINHNENLFRTTKLTIDILITFTFRAILTKLKLLGKNRSKILLQKPWFWSSKT